MRGRGLTARTRRFLPDAALLATLLTLLALPPFAPSARGADSAPSPIAGAFVFPIGDELDFKRPGPGEASGYHVSDPYLAVRKARKHRRRVHYGTDFSCGQGGTTVRAVAAGVVDVSDGNARVKVRRAQIGRASCRERVSTIV